MGLVFTSIAFGENCPEACKGKCGTGECAVCCASDVERDEVATDCHDIADTSKSKSKEIETESDDSAAGSGKEN